MKITLNFSQFLDNWPESRKNQFSYDALRAIFDYFTEYEEQTEQELEFDPIAICCDFNEYDSIEDAAKEYNAIDEKEEDETEEEYRARVLEYFKENTNILELDNGGIVLEVF